MQELRVNFDDCPVELHLGLAEVMAELPERFSGGAQGVALKFVQDDAIGKGGSAACDDDGVCIRYARRTDAFRALGRLMGADKADAEFNEVAKFTTLGIMIDVSRNAVMTSDTVKNFVRRCALMGINMIMLYAEDTYEIPGEPWFGYCRGRYSQEELRDIDGYADHFGIEMIPCIQTLGHLEQILQFSHFNPLRDTSSVILAENEESYDFIAKMLDAASAPFRSKRIHIGMDEAHDVGLGEYLRRFGVKRRFDILNDHLTRVLDLCKERGLKPMMWSDMYFRLGSKTGGYYDKDCVIPQEVIDNIPKDVQLVYWDYYHKNQEFYELFIDKHMELGGKPVFAGGVWTWNRFWTDLPFAFTMTEASMKACRAKELDDVITTLWGDDGNECDMFSALPALQQYAEFCYADEVDDSLMRRNFRGSCDSDFDAWVTAAKVRSVPRQPPTDGGASGFVQDNGNCEKALLWADVQLGMIDPMYDGVAVKEYYVALHKELTALDDGGMFGHHFDLPTALSKALSFKAELRRDIVAAYKAGDRARIEQIADGDLASAREAICDLWYIHRDLWMEMNKPFGWEVVEGRYGAILARLEGLDILLHQYADGEITEMAVFDGERMPLFDLPDGTRPVISWRRAATASVPRWL
jgi:hexosaminidase